MERTINGKRLQLVIGAEADGMKLEQYLRRTLQFSKAQIKSMKFRENGLLVGGERVRINYVLRSGDLLEILLEDEDRDSAHLECTQEPVTILYEDEDLIAVWKEAGLVVHPSHGHYQDTLSNRVHAYFAGKHQQVMIRSIGRLDRDTSGIVIFAKNQVAAARLWEQKENGIFWKEYLAVCMGTMEKETEENTWHTISSPIGKLPGDLMRMCVAESGKMAVTHYQVVCPLLHDRTLVRVRIETGRTHQIRVHMASIGYPLAGDVLYSDGLNAGITDNFYSGSCDTGMVLCAWRAELRQPFTGKRTEICAENLDRKMEKALSCEKTDKLPDRT